MSFAGYTLRFDLMGDVEIGSMLGWDTRGDKSAEPEMSLGSPESRMSEHSKIRVVAGLLYRGRVCLDGVASRVALNNVDRPNDLRFELPKTQHE